MTFKGEDEGTEGVLGDNSLENTIEDTQKGRYIDLVIPSSLSKNTNLSNHLF